MKNFLRINILLAGLLIAFSCSNSPANSTGGGSASSSSSTSGGVVTNELFGIFSDTVSNSDGLTWSTNSGVSDYWLNSWAASDGATVYELISGTSPAGDGNNYLRLYVKEGAYGGGITFALSNTTLGYDMSRFTNGYLVFSIAMPSYSADPIIAIERQEYSGPNHRGSQILLTNGAYGFQKDGNIHEVVIPISAFIQATTDEGLHGRMQASDFTNVGTFFQLRGQSTGGGNLTNVVLDNIYWYR